MEELLVFRWEAWESVISFLASEAGFIRRTHHARIVCDVFAQLLFPGESFLIWYDIPDEDAAAAAQKVCGLRIYRIVRMYQQCPSDMTSSTASGGWVEPLIASLGESNIPSVSS